MTTDIVVPVLGESVTEATIAKWLKQPGDAVAVDEPIVELETEKATVELGAPNAGVLAEILAAEGEDVAVGAVIGRIAAGGGSARAGAEARTTAVREAPREQPRAPARALRPAPAAAQSAAPDTRSAHRAPQRRRASASPPRICAPSSARAGGDAVALRPRRAQAARRARARSERGVGDRARRPHHEGRRARARGVGRGRSAGRAGRAGGARRASSA